MGSCARNWGITKDSKDTKGSGGAVFEAVCKELSKIGHHAGGRVGYFLHTDDFEASRTRMLAAGVVFEEDPRHESYGTVAVFRDLYGNRWDLIEPKPAQ